MKPFRFYLGVFLVTASVLMLQIVQSRILSGLAMFGMTAGTIGVYLASSLGVAVSIAFGIRACPGLSRSRRAPWGLVMQSFPGMPIGCVGIAKLLLSRRIQFRDICLSYHHHKIPSGFHKDA